MVGPVDFEDAPEKGAIVPALLGLAPFSFLSSDWRSCSSGATPLVGSEIFMTRKKVLDGIPLVYSILYPYIDRTILGNSDNNPRQQLS